MTEAIKTYCKKHGWKEPETVGQIAAVIYQSLADSYAETVREIESLTGRHFEAVNIVGGGSNAAYLNQLTADKSGRTVYAGPGEATAIGNLAVQMLKDNQFAGLAQVRACIYEPSVWKSMIPADSRPVLRMAGMEQCRKAVI